MAKKRKKCPMCGWAESSLLRSVTFDGKPDTWHVQCDNADCKARTPDMPTQDAALERWDTQPRRRASDLNTTLLANAVREHSAALLDEADVNQSLPLHKALCDAAVLVAVLARVVEGQELRRAFGAPGGWGYSTLIGAALASGPEPEA